MENLLEVHQLKIDFQASKQPMQQLVYPLNLHVKKGEIVGIVGESGSGKSLTMKSLMGILPEGVTSVQERFTFDGAAVTKMDQLPISMIFQDPMTSMNPLRTVGYHLIEVIRRTTKMKKSQARQLAIQELVKVGIPSPENRMKQYPHELSGGMRQRVMIAMALLMKPKLLIADEPTTALDVTIQAQILALIRRLQKEENLAVLLVTHDFGVVAGMCDSIKVMYKGHVVEEGTAEDIFYEPSHPYTKQLLKAANLGEKEQIENLVKPQNYSLENLQEILLSETHRVWLEGESNE